MLGSIIKPSSSIAWVLVRAWVHRNVNVGPDPSLHRQQQLTNNWSSAGLGLDKFRTKMEWRWAKPGHHSSWCQVTGPHLQECFVGRLDAEITEEASTGSETDVVPVLDRFFHSRAFQWGQNAAWGSSLELQNTINNGWNFLVPSYVSSLVANGQSGHLHPRQMG